MGILIGASMITTAWFWQHLVFVDYGNSRTGVWTAEGIFPDVRQALEALMWVECR